jgi:hypothetical protein
VTRERIVSQDAADMLGEAVEAAAHVHRRRGKPDLNSAADHAMASMARISLATCSIAIDAGSSSSRSPPRQLKGTRPLTLTVLSPSVNPYAARFNAKHQQSYTFGASHFWQAMGVRVRCKEHVYEIMRPREWPTLEATPRPELAHVAG